MPYADPVVLKTYKQQWAEKNREKVRASNRAWAAANPEKLRAKRQKPEYKAIRAADGRKRYLAMSEDLRKRRCFNSARCNAKCKGREFSITIDDLVWPEFCPVLGIKLNYGVPTRGKHSPDSPSIDRTDANLGYVKGNVVVMSWRANRIKTDATNEELFRLTEYILKTRSN